MFFNGQTMAKLPEEIKKFVDEKYHGKEIVLSIATDVLAKGMYGEEWLFLTKEEVFVVKDSDAKIQIVIEVPIKTITDARAINMVGGGALEVESEGKPHRLLLYSNAKAHDFTDAARIINDLAKKGTYRELNAERRRKYCPTCGKPIPGHTDVCPRCLKRHRTFSRLFEFAKPYRTKILSIFLIMICATLAGLSVPYISKILIDQVIRPLKDQWRLAPLALALLGANALQIFLRAVQVRIAAFVGNSAVYDIRRTLYKKLQNLSISYYDKRHTGALMTRVNSDTGEVQNFLVDWLPMLLESALTIIGIGVLLFVLSWRLTLYIIIPVFITVWFVRKVYPKLWLYFARFYDKRSRLSATVNDTLTGIRVVKAFGQEDKEQKRFEEKSKDFRDTSILLEQKFATYNPVLSITILFGTVVVWYVGGKLAFAGEMTLGGIVAYSGYLAMFYRPIFLLTDMTRIFTHSLSAGERIFEVLDAKSEVEDAPDAVSMPDLKGDIEFRNVTFGYNKLRPVLKNVSFKIDAKQSIGIVGRSGSGKSTVISLLCRLYDVDEGEILIDGVNIKKIKYVDLRKNIGIVLQEPFLFSGSIAENIAYSKSEAKMDEIIQAAKAANAHDFIMSKPDGYDTYVGERGGRLSLGERQRISIARALLHDPKILILDEATSSVDTETEKAIQEALNRLIKGRTTIAIAHRLSTLRNSDKIIVLDEGELAEMGSNDELMGKKGIFYKLIQIQTEFAKSRLILE